MSSTEHPYREAYMAKYHDPRIPEPIIDLAESRFMSEEVIAELLKYECEKTEEFQELVDMYNMAYQKMIEGMGIESYAVDSNKVHMIAANQLEKHLSGQVDSKDGIAGGFIHDGHMYLRDDLDMLSFFEQFSHEFMHLVSKTKKVIQVFIDEQGWEPAYRTKNRILRSGVHQVSERDEGAVQYGFGFNEAITEIFALELRKLTVFPDDFSEEVIDGLRTNETTYFRQVKVVKEVVRKYLGVEEISEVRLQMLRMYIMGDPAFLKSLTQAFRRNNRIDGMKILFSMGVSEESVNQVVESLELSI